MRGSEQGQLRFLKQAKPPPPHIILPHVTASPLCSHALENDKCIHPKT